MQFLRIAGSDQVNNFFVNGRVYNPSFKGTKQYLGAGTIRIIKLDEKSGKKIAFVWWDDGIKEWYYKSELEDA